MYRKNPMAIAQGIVWSFVNNKKEFTLQELFKEIKENGGVLRVGPSYSVTEYIECLEDSGTLFYSNGKYIVRKNKGADSE